MDTLETYQSYMAIGQGQAKSTKSKPQKYNFSFILLTNMFACNNLVMKFVILVPSDFVIQ
jgi:hypothetical protein